MKVDFDKKEIKKLLNKTLKDIQKFEKFSQEDQIKKKLEKTKICSQKKTGCSIKSHRFYKKTKPLKNSLRCLQKTTWHQKLQKGS